MKWECRLDASWIIPQQACLDSRPIFLFFASTEWEKKLNFPIWAPVEHFVFTTSFCPKQKTPHHIYTASYVRQLKMYHDKTTTTASSEGQQVNRWYNHLSLPFHSWSLFPLILTTLSVSRLNPTGVSSISLPLLFSSFFVLYKLSSMVINKWGINQTFALCIFSFVLHLSRHNALLINSSLWRMLVGGI